MALTGEQGLSERTADHPFCISTSRFLQQQAKFDDFIDCYNRERPHQALDEISR
jgi:hypothetical protein